jgi:spore maturation protein CgeB
MNRRALTVAFFGSSLVSAYWNSSATYYRGILRALAARGHRITFYEPDAFDRQKHRDIADPPWARVVVYSGTDERAALRALEEAKGADVLVKASGVGVFDELLEAGVLAHKRAHNQVVFWDVDAPATLDRARNDPTDPFRSLVPRYDVVFTYGGGDPVVRGYEALGARRCIPVYHALDPDTHFEAAPEARFIADLSLLANRIPDREARVDAFFFETARAMPHRRFLLGGNGWSDKPMSANVRNVGHVYTVDHNAFNASALAVLNVARDASARSGFSPASRLFEAAGAAACIITDAWEGLEHFLEPEREILVAHGSADVVRTLRELTPEHARRIGQAAKRRVLAGHTYAERAKQVEAILMPPSALLPRTALAS